MSIVLQTDASDFFRGVALPLAGLFAFAVIGWFAVIAVRKAFRGEDGGAEAFTLDELRRLHRAGELSDEEFARAKESMLGIARRAKEPVAGTPAARKAAPIRPAVHPSPSPPLPPSPPPSPPPSTRDADRPIAESPSLARSATEPRTSPAAPAESDAFRSVEAPRPADAPHASAPTRPAPIRPAALDEPTTRQSRPSDDP